MFKPEGVYVAMMTPVDDKKKVNEEALRQYTEFCIQGGVDGLFPVSSVGEFIHFSLEEKKRIVEIVFDQTRGRIPVVAGASDTRPENSIELAKHAREVGCQGAVICPPYYYPISEELVEKHYEAVADALPDFPIIMYNIPAFTSRIGYDVVKRLSRRQNIVGLKDSSGSMIDLIHYIDKVRIVGSDFNVLTGREETFLPSLAAGAKGCMTATAGILPEVMVGIYRLFQRNEWERARRLQYSFLALLRAMASLPFPVGFKAALEFRGIPMGPPLQPLSEAEEYTYLGTKARIENLMGEILDNLSDLAAAS